MDVYRDISWDIEVNVLYFEDVCMDVRDDVF